MPKPKTVRLYPVPGVSVYPYPAVVFDATPEEADLLLSHIPPPFTTDPPGDAPDTPPTDPPDNGGSTDSED